MTANVETVVIPNAAGQRLYGILHTPSNNAHPGLAIVLLSPGIKGRVAPHRLYVKLARRLCGAGFRVLRFDFNGLSDADGELDEKMVVDVYAAVSVGRYVDDTIAAMDWLQSQHRIDKFVLSGLCGGAITGLFAGARDQRVDALVGLALPVIQYGNNSMRYRYLSSGEQSQFRRGYVRRLLDWKSWLRLLTFRSDYSVILKVFLAPLKNAFRSKVVPAAAASAEGEGNLNTYFPPAFFKMLSGSQKLFLVFGATDRLYWDFDEKFYRQRKPEIERSRGRFELRLIKEARHIFEERAHQEELFDSIVAWLEREYSSGSVRTAAARQNS